MEGTFVKLFRDIENWEWYKDSNTKAVFIHCLIKANWKDGKHRGYDIPRGSFVSSTKQIAVQTGLSIQQTKTAIKHLQLTSELTIKTTNKFSVFTVKNYNRYQEDNKQNDTQLTSEQQTTNNQLTINQQTTNKQLTTIEEYKEDKEYKEDNNIINKENINILSVSNDTDCLTQDVRLVIEMWNSLESYGITPVRRLNGNTQRYDMLRARIKEYGMDEVSRAIAAIKESDFLQGKHSGKPWQITFDWFVRPNNFPKVLEGNYSNKVEMQRSVFDEWRDA